MRRPLLLFLDWDSTLTTISTLPLIASIGTYPHIPHPKLSALSNAYLADLQTHEKAYPLTNKQRTSLSQEIEYLRSLRPVEKTSLERVDASKIFDGVSRQRAREGGAACISQGQVALRDGWASLIDTANRSGGTSGAGQTSIVSIAWSREFVRACLGESYKQGSSLAEQLNVEVHANEIDFSGDGALKGDGDSTKSNYILTASDKLNVMKASVELYKSRWPLADPLTVYIGDSPTDLACLLHADVGICMRDEALSMDQRALKETLDRLNVSLRSIDEYPGRGVIPNSESGDEPTLWWTMDFTSVRQSVICS